MTCISLLTTTTRRGTSGIFVSRTIAFYNNELFLRQKDGQLVRIDVPNSVNKSVFRDYLLLELARSLGSGRNEVRRRFFACSRFRQLPKGERQLTVLLNPPSGRR